MIKRSNRTQSPPPAEPPQERPGTRQRLRILQNPFGVGFFVTLGGLAAFAVGLAVSNLSTIIIYIVFALFAALGLDPIVRFLERHKLPRPWAIVTTFVGFGIILAGVLLLIIPTVVKQITQLVEDIPSIIREFQASDFYTWLLDSFGDNIGDIVSQIQSFLTNPSNIAAIGGGVLEVGVSIVSTMSGMLIVLVLSLYFLASMRTIKTSFYSLAPAYARPRVASLTEQITESVGGYLMGMVILAFFNAVFSFIMFLILQLPFPALLAVVAFCITLIPLVGTVMFWVIASVLALFTSPISALIFAAAYLVYMQLEAYVLTPKIMNRAISIPGSLVVIGALVGGTLLGLLGALVAIPVTASLLLIVKQVIIPRQDAKDAPS